jgi:hypothetical protein
MLIGFAFPPWPYWHIGRRPGIVVLVLWLGAWFAMFFLWAGVGLVALMVLSAAGLMLAIRPFFRDAK